MEAKTDQDTARQAFFSAGYEAGRKFGDRILEKWDLDFPEDSIMIRVNRWCDFDSDVGWGRLTNNLAIDEQKGRISGVIRLLDNFQTYKRAEANHSDCSLMFGYIKGVMESLCSGVPFSVECKREQCPLSNPFKRERGCTFQVMIEREQK